MTQRIFRSVWLAAVMVLLASVVLIMGVLYDYFSTVQQSQLKMQLEVAAQAVSHEGMEYFQDLHVRNYRITWIDGEGDVRYDSGSDTDENHMEREEVVEALSSGYGESKRYSSTLMEQSLYVAQRLDDGTVLRLSISQNSILTLVLGMAQPICIVFLLAILLSLFLATRLSRNIVRPLNAIDLDHPLENEGYDELAPLLRRIDSQQRQLNVQKAELAQKQNELDTIINSMNEGMILLNAKRKILSINPAAGKLLGADRYCIGEDLLAVSRNLNLQETVSKALQGHRETQIVTLGTGRYQIDANPIVSDGTTVGAALCFFDVTEAERTEQMRREFTANVSHELKTPLHSISGYAELLQNGMVNSEDIIPFSRRIYGEAQRMIHLVEDIISLSHLDEGAGGLEWENTDLYALSLQVVRELETEARAVQVTMDVCGSSTVVYGVPQLLSGIVHNLCDNAIKYNRPGGRVTVAVEGDGTSATLSVSDTGIGIPADQQSRIFERFYRVDKSRSKEVGGTGLGLSIVKHAAMVHRASIEMTSAPGQGTTITVRFPMDETIMRKNTR